MYCKLLKKDPDTVSVNMHEMIEVITGRSISFKEIMETMAIMEQLARKEPRVRKETKEIWDQGESVAIMDPKARRVTLGSLQSYRYKTSASRLLQWRLVQDT